MHYPWLRSNFLNVIKFLQIKDKRSNFSWDPIFQKIWIIWSTLLYFNFKRFMVPMSLPFIRFQCILHDSGVLFSESWNFYKLKRGDLISGGNHFCRKSELFSPPFCISILKDFCFQSHYRFKSFQWILHDSGVLSSESWIFHKIERGDLTSGGDQFCRKSESIGTPFSISIWKVF